MSQMFITPIQIGEMPNISIKAPAHNKEGSDSVFKGIFQTAINDVVVSEKELEQQQYLLATGQIDDAHTVPIATAKAQMSVDLLLALRTKAVEAYNEIIRLSV